MSKSIISELTSPDSHQKQEESKADTVYELPKIDESKYLFLSKYSLLTNIEQ
jgi:hypothetical protein